MCERKEVFVSKTADHHLRAALSVHSDGSEYVLIQDHETLNRVVIPLATFREMVKAVEKSAE
jgi:hypothetical protein